MTTGTGIDEKAPARRATSGWRRLLAAASLASVGTLLAVALMLGDVEAGAYAVGLTLGVALLRVRRGRIGEIALALLSVNVFGWMALGAMSNISGGQGLVAVLIPALLASLALAGLLAAIGAIAAGGNVARSARPPMIVTAVAATAFAALLAAGAVTGEEGPSAVPGQLAVATDNVRFAPTALEASAGEIVVSVTNGDLFWHTFTIDELSVDLPVAVGAERRAVFDAEPGAYAYYCRIPGHEALMQGTLTVTSPAETTAP
ncbi:MAG TPA: cupredoxin domain-containing protein [Egibacteraceae bacterium]|nr:cupredoxin domain-containing protein [Egibacteraceae bacterium]